LWHEGGNFLDRVAFLAPNHPEGKQCRWLESWDIDDTIDICSDTFSRQGWTPNNLKYTVVVRIVQPVKVIVAEQCRDSKQTAFGQAQGGRKLKLHKAKSLN
jgi:hypothetical protein